MKIRRWEALWLVLAVVLAGCSGFWDLPASSTTTTTTTLSSGIFYVLNQTTNEVVAYYISSGTLDEIGSYTLAATPLCMAVAPNGGFLYVDTASGIYVYTIASGGGLTIANGGNVISSDIVASMQVSPAGDWLVETFSPSTGEVEVVAIPISTSTGLNTSTTEETQTFSVSNATAEQLAISPDEEHVFIAAGSGGTLVVPFTATATNPLSSTATTITVTNSDSSALSVAVDPSDRLFYIGETNADSAGSSGGIRVFEYSTLGGTLTQASGSPIASGGLAPNAILPISSGDYVYIANGEGDTASGNVTYFSVTESSSTSYTVASGGTVSTGIMPKGLAEDSDGNFVLAVNDGGTTSAGSPDFEAFSMSSGALTANLKSTTGTDPVGAIAIVALP
jgi:6-phosphogluconolactonase (cycloisomerase 2 family)